MDEKKENCKRCGVAITPKTKRAEFCSPKCKVYWHRENKDQKEFRFLKEREKNISEETKTKVVAIMDSLDEVKIKTFEELLADAKNGSLDERELYMARMTTNQRDLIKRKANQK